MLDRIASRRPAIRVPHDPATLSQRILVDILGKAVAGSRPAELDSYCLATLEAATEFVLDYPDGARLQLVLQREIALRRCCPASTLDALPGPGAPGAERPAIFRGPPASAPEPQVRAFLDAAVRTILKPEVAAEIEFFEQLARDLDMGRIDLRDLPALQARAPRSSPPTLAALYLHMGYEAARLCMTKRTDEIQRGAVGPRAMVDHVLAPCALRLARGENDIGTDPAAAHTLRFSINARLRQIASLEGAARIGPEEMALRVALSFEEPEFLLDARLPLNRQPGESGWRAIEAIATIDAFYRSESGDDT